MRRRSFFLPISKRFSLVVSTLCHVRLKYTSQHSKQQLSIFPTHVWQECENNVWFWTRCTWWSNASMVSSQSESGLSCLAAWKNPFMQWLWLLSSHWQCLFSWDYPCGRVWHVSNSRLSLFKWFRSWSQKIWFCKKSLIWSCEKLLQIGPLCDYGEVEKQGQK